MRYACRSSCREGLVQGPEVFPRLYRGPGLTRTFHSWKQREFEGQWINFAVLTCLCTTRALGLGLDTLQGFCGPSPGRLWTITRAFVDHNQGVVDYKYRSSAGRTPRYSPQRSASRYPSTSSTLPKNHDFSNMYALHECCLFVLLRNSTI